VFAHEDGRVLRIVSIVRVELVEEFVENARYAIWQVEPA
jgi:hypothetical protein